MSEPIKSRPSRHQLMRVALAIVVSLNLGGIKITQAHEGKVPQSAITRPLCRATEELERLMGEQMVTVRYNEKHDVVEIIATDNCLAAFNYLQEVADSYEFGAIDTDKLEQIEQLRSVLYRLSQTTEQLDSTLNLYNPSKTRLIYSVRNGEVLVDSYQSLMERNEVLTQQFLKAV